MRKVGQVSLERALSKLGIASRTQARGWIEAGRVRVNGRVLTNPLYGVTPETAKIEIDGARVEKSQRIVLLLHKTRGTITTRSDERGRPTVFTLVPKDYEKFGNLHAVGRLDFATTGLLLLTNDTRLSSWLTDPVQQIPRIYRVTVRGELNEEKRQKMLRGIDSEVGVLQASSVELLKTSTKESHFMITLLEGKNREIRRLCEAVDCEVTVLKRVSYGGIELRELQPGQVREVSEEELLAAFPGSPRSTALK